MLDRASNSIISTIGCLGDVRIRSVHHEHNPRDEKDAQKNTKSCAKDCSETPFTHAHDCQNSKQALADCKQILNKAVDVCMVVRDPDPACVLKICSGKRLRGNTVF